LPTSKRKHLFTNISTEESIDLPRGAELFLRSHKLCSSSTLSQHFVEPEVSLKYSNELPTCLYPEPDHSTPHHPILYLQDSSYYFPPTSFFVFRVNSFLLAFPSNSLHAFRFLRICAQCIAHLILLGLFIILIILGE
jgi:hypothetical protein